MALVKLFTKPGCPLCVAAKKLLDVSGIPGECVEEFDMETDVGLAEGMYNCVLAVPSIVIVSDNGETENAWRGNLPGAEDLRKTYEAARAA